MNAFKLLCAVALLLVPTTALAQTERFQIEAKLLVAKSGELDATDIGLGGRVSWHPSSWIGLEGEFGVYPADLPDNVPITASRTEGLFGVTAGPRYGAIRPFARLRTGFLRFAESPGPVACILIFPPPLSCTLAASHTGLTVDAGGGLEVSTASRTFVRFDLGVRLVRYPGPAFDRDRDVHDNDFFGPDFRLGIGAGWRF